MALNRVAHGALALGALIVILVLYDGLLGHAGPAFAANWGIDFGDYWLAAGRVLLGHSPYAPVMLAGPFPAIGLDRFRYPPLFALAAAPLTMFSESAATAVWAALSGLGFLAGAALAARAAGARLSLAWLFWTVMGLAFFLPVFDSLWKGNLEGLEVLLLGLAMNSRSLFGSGALVLLGIFKVAPLAIWPAAIRRDPRSFVKAVGLIGTLGLLSWPWLAAGWRDYPTILANQLAGSSVYAANLAPASALALLVPNLPILATLARLVSWALAAALIVASLRWAPQPGGWPVALAAATMASLLIPAVLWYHYLALAVPFLCYAFVRSGRLMREWLLLSAILAVLSLGATSGGLLFALPLGITLLVALRPQVKLDQAST